MKAGGEIMRPIRGIVKGGKNIYGFPIGILMLHTQFPRIPGEMGNAYTWDFPVLYKVVKGASVTRVVEESDPKLLEPFITAANELVNEGVSAVTTNCGFLAMFQRELAEAIPVPVFTSTLLMVPMVHRMLKPSQKVGIISVNASTLGEKQFRGVGIEGIPCVCTGLETEEHFSRTLIQNRFELDVDKAREEHRRVARRFVEENPDIGAIVLECTNMPPYAEDIREVTGLPVFDIVTLVNFVYHSLVKPQYRGLM
jgi:Asp/Glu/hydantoin racemase